jgi:hypothetical protein
MKEFGDSNVGLKILQTIGVGGPTRDLQHGVMSQFLRDAKALCGPQRRDPVPPVLVLLGANGAPIPREKLADAAGDHEAIVALVPCNRSRRQDRRASIIGTQSR